MIKVHVHELVKELGITSKRLFEVLKEGDGFVESISSAIGASVVRKAHEYIEAHPELVEEKKKSAKKPTSQAKAGKSGERVVDPNTEKADDTKSQNPSHARASKGKGALGNGSTSAQASPTAERTTPRAQSGDASASGPKPGPAATAPSSKAPVEKTDKPREAAGVKAAKPAVPKPGALKPSTLRLAGDKSRASKLSNPRKKRSGGGGPKPQASRPDNNPFAPAQRTSHPGDGELKPWVPRPGDNPFASAQEMPCPGGGQHQQGKSGG